jgi:NADPH:quinone reductase-like Zn-dependent oxidoreductase
MKHARVTLILLLLAGSAAQAAGTMRAIVLADGRLQLESVPVPEPKSGEVRIRVRAASVNPVDWKLAQAAAPGSRLIPGRDLAGVIDAVGPDAGDWHPGQAVIALATNGAYAQYAIASVHALARKPAHMSFAQGAGLPIVGETAWRAMVTVANVQAGQRVLIQGGADT